MAIVIEELQTVGTGSWTVPSNISGSFFRVMCWAGGGGGGGMNTSADGGGGGGGGGKAGRDYSGSQVVAGQSWTYVIGYGGAGGVGAQSGSFGGDTWWSASNSPNIGTIIVARGGGGGATTSGVGGPPGKGGGSYLPQTSSIDVANGQCVGAKGGEGRDSATGRGGPGGMSGYDNQLASVTDEPTPWVTATSTIPTSSMAGRGGNGGNANGRAGFDGLYPGGGGGGAAEGTGIAGGSGSKGRILLFYTTIDSSPNLNPTFILWQHCEF